MAFKMGSTDDMSTQLTGFNLVNSFKRKKNPADSVSEF